MTPEHRWRNAEKFRSLGDEGQARQAYASLLDVATVAPYAHLRLSQLASAVGDVRLATEHVLRVDAARLQDPALQMPCCQQLFALGEVEAGLRVAMAMADGPSAAFPALAETAKLLSDCMEPQAALLLLARARARGLPDSAGAFYLDGLNRLYLGEFDAARDRLLRAIAAEPSFAPAFWSLAKLRLEEGRAARIAHLFRLVETLGDAHADAPLLLYSLFHELDAEDLPERAWPVLVRAMRARRSQVAFSEDGDAQLFRRLHAVLPRLADAAAASPLPGPRPVMVVGLPRSGTTIIEQTLCSGHRMASAGELRDFVRQMRWVANRAGPPHLDAALLDALADADLHLLGRRYAARASRNAGDEPHYADKWPENYLAMGHALAALPTLSVVAVCRDAMDACWSNLKEWFGASYHYSYDIAETAGRHARYIALLDAAREAFDARITRIDYESFVAAPRDQAALVAGRIGLEPRACTAAIQGAVATASSVQVRAGVTARNVGSWRRYQRWLQPLQSALDRANEAARSQR